MAGIYFHIPFCRKACTYCDFHFSTSEKTKEAVRSAMVKELEDRANELQGTNVSSIYFGGGTPSLLTPDELGTLLGQARRSLKVTSDAEVTLEANPDDITADRLASWKEMGITRLSLGTQSFQDDRLQVMGRAHTAADALRSIGLIAVAGFHSWTIDLIYGLPGMDLKEWDEQLRIALDHGMPHLSAYCLTVEPGTVLHHQVRKGVVIPATDPEVSAQFDHLMATMDAEGLIHYEISNFGREGHFSRHNRIYWNGEAYLGIGPSAHSFVGNERRWNVANNVRYARSVSDGTRYWEAELVGPKERTNEMIMTGLRTMWGVDLGTLPIDIRKHDQGRIVQYIRQGLIEKMDGRLVLSKAGRHLADRIASDLFVLDDR